MKYIKQYEAEHSSPWFNDYVIIYNFNDNDNLSKVLRQLIGRITKVERISGVDKYWIAYKAKDFLFQDVVKVDQSRKDKEHWKCIVDRDKITHFSKYKRKMSLILQQNKYNI